jgi:transcriptional regulator with PAS, ATPase and Fis domain
VLQEREFLRLGSSHARQADVRVVAATNQDLATLVADGRFRDDLYYRLAIFAIHLPSLHQRQDDIIALSQTLLEDIGRQLVRPAAGLSREARPVLLAYHWPGNVRELRNVLERASILADGGLITSEHLALQPVSPGVTPDSRQQAPTPPPEPTALPTLERQLIEQALQATRFNKTRAAARLGLTRSQLYVRLRRYGLDG